MKSINLFCRKSAIIISRYSKLPGLALFVFLAGLVRFISLPTHYSSESFYLDAGWFLALQEQLQHGQLLGRDIYFTYGPLSQLIAYLGVFLRDNPDPIVGGGASLFMFGFIAPSIVLVASIMMIREINLFSAIFILVIFFLLPGLLFVRSQMLLFSAILFAYGLAQPPMKRRVLAVVSGLSWFAGQTLATDTGIFSLMTAVTFTAFMVIISFPFFRRLAPKINLLPSRVYMESFLVGFSVFVFLNLILEFYYLSTSPYYAFFDNIRYNIAIARGYSLTMGFPWSSDFLLTIILFTIVMFNIINLFLAFRRNDIEVDSFYIKFAILISGLVLLRGSITRSDIGHILQAFSIQYFLMILIILTTSSVLVKHIGMTLLVFLVLSYPGAGFAEVNRFLEVVGSSSLRERIQDIRAVKADTRGLAPDELLHVLDSKKKIINFPFANYVTMALGLCTFAPILQTYAANNQDLQEFYINRIDAARSDVEVIYAIDGFSADGGAVDDVQNVTRVPIIAEYLVEHFRLKYPIAFRDALYVLEPREQPLELQRTPILFSLTTNDKEVAINVTSNPGMCTYAELEMAIDYPWYSVFGRPNSLIATFERNGVTTVTGGLVAIESGKPFSTFFYLGEPFAYSQVFASYPNRAILGAFDRIVIRPAPATLFTVNPTNVRIIGLDCVNVPLQQRQSHASPYLLAAGQSLNLWERSWIPGGPVPDVVRRVPDGLFIHSEWDVDLGPYAVPPGVCFTAIASFDPEVAGKPEADGAEFVVTILSDSQTFSKTVALMPGETAMLQVPVPDDAPFWVKMETRPRGNSAWDWAIWRTPRLAPCEQN